MALCEDWCDPADVAECAPDVDAALVADAVTLASEVLYHATGARFGGLCEAVVRPCARRTASPWPRRLDGWEWHRSWGTCTCNADPAACSCQTLPQIGLGLYPVREIVEVVIGGAVLDPSAYRLDEQRWLVRVDGYPWPCCQDLTLAITEPDTWAVRFVHGTPVPAGGEVAAKRYACELAKGFGGLECELPSRVSSLTRQGVTVGFTDPATLLDSGATGIAAVDAWVRAVNGGHRRAHLPATISSPDVGRRVRRVSDGDPAS